MARPPAPTTKSIGEVRVSQRDGRWRVRWTDRTGQRRELSAQTEAEADRLAAEAWVRLTTPGSALQPGITFEALVMAYLDPAAHPKWRSGNTRSQLVGFARNHVGHGDYGIARRSCDSLDTGDWMGVLEAMAEKGYAPSTIQGVMDLMRAAVEWGQDRGVWDRWATPYKDVALPPTVEAPDGVTTRIDPSLIPTTASVASLASAADLLDWRYGLMFRLFAGSGLRWGEMIALRPEDVDLDQRHLHIGWQWREIDGRPERARPKHNRQRTTIFPAELGDPMAKLLAGAKPGVELFRSPKGCIWRRSNFGKRIFAEARRGSVDPGYREHHTIHSLRHFFCSDLIARGVKIATVSKLAGHSTVRFTLDRYVGATEDYLEEATNIV